MKSSWSLELWKAKTGHGRTCNLSGSWAPELKVSWTWAEAWHPEESLGDATSGTATQVQQEITTFWRCQYHSSGMITKNSSMCVVEMTWAYYTRHVCCSGWSWRGEVSTLKEPRSRAEPRYWTLSYLYTWGLVLLWFECDYTLDLLSWRTSLIYLLIV